MQEDTVSVGSDTDLPSLSGCSCISGAAPNVDAPGFRVFTGVSDSLIADIGRCVPDFIEAVDSVVASDRLFLTSCWDES
jgi:hypothetical protein